MSNVNFSRRDQSLQWLRVGELVVNWPEAQRALAEKNAKKIAEDFDPDYFGTLTVSPLPDGKYHVDDGWTRRCAVQILYGDNERVPCVVVPATDASRAAMIFTKMNGGRVKPTGMEMFRVAVTAKSPDESAVDKIVRSLGMRVTNEPVDGTIRAVGSLLAIYRQYGDNALRATLLTIQAIWGREYAAYDGYLLRGMAMFLSEEDIGVDREKLARKMVKRFTPGRLIGAAKANRESFGNSMHKAVAQIIREVNQSYVRTPSPSASRSSTVKSSASKQVAA